MAVRAHASQLRKDRRTPYVVHPVGVLRILCTNFGITDPEILSAAVLHDILEDTPVTRAQLLARFGKRVVGLVEELTIPPEFHGPSVADSVKTRVLVAAMRDISWTAVLIKLADRLDNLSDMSSAAWNPEKRRAYRSQTRAMVEALTQRWRKAPPPAALAGSLRKARAAVRERSRRTELTS
jgi:guanosine-3',5'-bis(diphosphate) 3'-pyrophosphohydrolase